MNYWIKYLVGLIALIAFAALVSLVGCSPYMVNARMACESECENCAKQKMSCEVDRGVKPNAPPIVVQDETPLATAVKQAATPTAKQQEPQK